MYASFEWPGLALVMFYGVLMYAAFSRRIPFRWFVGLLAAAIALRLFGSFARHFVLFNVYNGSGDATVYLMYGRDYAEALREFDLSIFGEEHRYGKPLWGTQALRYLTGMVLTTTGDTVRGAFLAFSLMSFAGLAFITLAFYRVADRVRTKQYALLVWLWPSLWFWPCSVGKEAALLFFLGLTTLGYVGKKERVSWIILGFGLAGTFWIRPHFAAVLVCAMAFAEFATVRRWTPARIAQGVVLGVVMVVVLLRAASAFGVDPTDLESIQQFQTDHSQQTQSGGSNIGGLTGGVLAIPLAFVNILARPFIFEAHNPMALVSALEIAFMWFLVYRRRRHVWAGLKNWRDNRLLRFALPTTAMYVLMLGMTFSNLGIIARQRSLILPFLFVLLALGGSHRRNT